MHVEKCWWRWSTAQEKGLGCSLHHLLMTGSVSWAELSGAIISVVFQARKPEVIFPTHSLKPLPKASRHVVWTTPAHCDVSLVSLPLSLQPGSNDLPPPQRGLTWPPFLKEHFSGWPCCSTPGGALSIDHNMHDDCWWCDKAAPYSQFPLH